MSSKKVVELLKTFTQYMSGSNSFDQVLKHVSFISSFLPVY